MKKLILVIVCFIWNIMLVNAFELSSSNLDYFVKYNDEVINVKKIYINDNELFNVNLDNYNIENNFVVDDKLNIDSDLFNTITYYGYSDKNDINYFITQYVLWKRMFNDNIVIVNNVGEVINDYDELVNSLENKVNKHYTKPNIFNRDRYDGNLWNTSIIPGKKDDIKLDIIDVEGLDITYEGNNLVIKNNKVGKYNINLEKIYKHQNYYFSDGINMYYINLGGPKDLKYSFEFEVKAVTITVSENIDNASDKIGDAYSDGTYDIYCDNIYYETLNLGDNYIRAYSPYVLDNKNDKGMILNTNTFEVNNKNMNLVINKRIINKTFEVSVLDNNKYDIYLKSNNELYESIDKNTKELLLPYGLYYILNESDETFYQEINVLDEESDVINLNNVINNEEENENQETEIIIDEPINDEKTESEIESKKDNDESIEPEVISQDVDEKEEKIVEDNNNENEDNNDNETINSEIENYKNDRTFYVTFFLVCATLITIIIII